jgi:hypothetical protein
LLRSSAILARLSGSDHVRLKLKLNLSSSPLGKPSRAFLPDRRDDQPTPCRCMPE